MLFHANKHALNFELAGRRYVVALGEAFDVPDRFAYCIKAHGIAAAEGSGDGAVVTSTAAERPRLVSIADKDEIVTPAMAAEELADLSGEDPIETDDEGVAIAKGSDNEPADDDISDDEAADRTLAQLDQQGIRVPGKRPKKVR